MDRPLVVAILVMTLLASGCATQPVTFIPPGVDRNELLEAIAKNGQGGGAVETAAPDKPDPLTTILVGGVEVTGKLAVICAALALVVAYGICRGGGSISSDGLPNWLGH
jgi:hypothetical protein